MGNGNVSMGNAIFQVFRLRIPRADLKKCIADYVGDPTQQANIWSNRLKGALLLTNTSVLFRETTFRPLGVLGPQIFTCARDSPRLASAHHNRGWGSAKYFSGEHVTFGSIFSVCAPNTLWLLGVTSRDFTRRRDLRQT